MRAFSSLLASLFLLSVSAQPCVDFQACFQASGTGPAGYFFNNCTPNEGGTQFVWDFGDGGQSTQVAPTHTYLSDGTYQVCLTAYWQDCVDSTCTILNVVGAPCSGLNADFTWSGTPNGFQFSNGTTGIGQSTSFSWNFGDGSQSTDPQPFHTFPEPGSYQVCLLSISVYPTPNGPITCTSQHCELVVVGGAACDPGFAVAYAVTSNVGGEVQFVATSNHPETHFIWTFGDGTEGYGPALAHTYAEEGSYTVCLAGWYYNEALQDSCWAEACGTVVVGGGDPCANYESCFDAAPLTGHAYFFINCSTLSFESTSLWDFGDGSTSTQFGPMHTYPGPGTYTTCLTTTWPGCVEEFCMDVVVGGDPCSGFEACFATTPLQQPGAFYFDNCSQGQQGTQYLWDFGDGTGSTGTNVDHVFVASGTYTVCLSAFWGNCSDSTCTVVTVNDVDPCIGLEAGFDHFTTPNGTLFSNTSSGTGNQTTFYWTFGDGSSSTDPQPIHLYPEDGLYEACLQVISIFELPNGGPITCVDTTCSLITIGQPGPCDALDPGFYYSGGLNGMNFGHDVIDLSWTYHWNFGDGTVGIGPSPYHVYPEAGTYHTCLVVSTWDPVAQDTCYADHCEWITVGGGDPCDQLEACILVNDLGNGSFLFENCSSIIQGAQFVWDLGNGVQVTDVIADHTYTEPGTYTVCLTAYWQACTDQTCVTITVGGTDPCDELMACFEALPFENGVFHFANCTQTLLIDIPEYYQWDFGDGSTSTEAEPDHTFPPGTYTVCLTVEQGDCVDSTCTTLTVGNGIGCDPGFACAFTYDVQTTAVIFFGTSNRVVDGWVWDFGDGTEGYTSTITHLYEPPGPFEVCLSAWYWNEAEQDSCWTTHCEEVGPFDPTGIGHRGLDGLSIFPNPASKHMTISGLSGPTVIQLFGVDGRVVLSERVAGALHTISVAGLARGPYVLRAEAEGQVVRRQLIIE